MKGLPEDGLPGLLEDDFRHPMWSPVDANPDGPAHITALHKRLHSSMVPFDGRPHCRSITRYAEVVWNITDLSLSRDDAYWLIGMVVKARTEALEQAPEAQQPAIRRLCMEYIDTIAAAA